VLGCVITFGWILEESISSDFLNFNNFVANNLNNINNTTTHGPAIVKANHVGTSSPLENPCSNG
jgi:hypothetical protein